MRFCQKSIGGDILGIEHTGQGPEGGDGLNVVLVGDTRAEQELVAHVCRCGEGVMELIVVVRRLNTNWRSWR